MMVLLVVAWASIAQASCEVASSDACSADYASPMSQVTNLLQASQSLDASAALNVLTETLSESNRSNLTQQLLEDVRPVKDLGANATKLSQQDSRQNASRQPEEEEEAPVEEESASEGAGGEKEAAADEEKDAAPAPAEEEGAAEAEAGGGKGRRQPRRGGNKEEENEGEEAEESEEEDPEEFETQGAFGGESRHGPHGHVPTREEAGIRIALSLTMISMVAVTMGLFYLTNWPDPDIRRATWSVIASTLTIFCAIVAFNALKELTMGLLNEPDEFFATEFSDEPEFSVLIHHVLRAVVLLVMLYGLLYSLRNNPRSLEVVAGIGAHIVGFALIEAFGTLQLRSPFIYNPMMSLVAVLLAASVIGAVVFLGSSLRESQLNSTTDAPVKHAFEEAENDYTGLTMGLLCCQVIKFLIVGHIAPIHGAPKGKTLAEVCMLASAGVGMAVVVIGVSAARTFVLNDQLSSSRSRIRRLCDIAERGASMALGWIMLYAGQWAFWTMTGGEGVAGGDDMIAGMLMLVVFGIIGFALIFLVEYLADYGIIQRPAMEALINGVGLSLALTWEITVDTSVQCMHTVIPHHGVRFIDAAVDAFLCGIVIPAQVLYILPRAQESHNYFSEKSDEEHHHHANHQRSHKEFHNPVNWR
mmetsp:Transcript_59833/g.110788  ORF Transcript_59833/g.110788 Transcript_59833/m.110788 type:complete len:644 (-) Transcript_59833:63-1994(-)